MASLKFGKTLVSKKVLNLTLSRKKSTFFRVQKQTEKFLRPNLVSRENVLIHTSPKRPINPLLGLLLKTKGIKILKGTSIILGRYTRRFYDKLPKSVRDQYTKHKVSFTIASLSLIYIVYYSYVHYDTCPLTGRKRWISFTKDQILALANINHMELEQTYNSKFAKKDSEVYKQCKRIVQNIVNGNSDLSEINNIDWKLSVILDDDVNNAFVLPNGEIYVFTGMINILESWEELAMIIGHEMSHAILGHMQEQQSFIAFGEILMIPFISFIWFVFDDFLAFLIYSMQEYIYPKIFNLGFNLPFSRKLELEADKVGLMLAAKACYDPRFSVLLWDKMSLKAACDSFATGEDDLVILEYISTHPSHERRASILEECLSEAQELRSKCNCPKILSHKDPLKEALFLRGLAQNIRERTKLRQEITLWLQNKDQTSVTEQKLMELETKLSKLEAEFRQITKPPEVTKQDNFYGKWMKNFRSFFKLSSLNLSGSANINISQKDVKV